MSFVLKRTLWIICCLCPVFLKAQFLDSLQLQIGTNFTLAQKDYQPLWLVANRYATISEEKTDVSSYLYFSNQHIFNSSGKYIKAKPYLALDYGMAVYNNAHFKINIVQQAYMRFSYGKWALRAGRYEQSIGEVHQELSSGSLGISQNALPIPKISIANSDYVEVPFTNGWLQFKGVFSHGWMGKERQMQRAFLHEKALHLRVGKNKLMLYGGVQHYGIWGGIESDTFKMDRSFQGFMNVVLVKEADDGSVHRFHPDIRPNRAGMQRGSVDGGVLYEGEYFLFHFYTQTPIETGTSITFRNIDRLVGISLDNKNRTGVIQSVLLEFLYTKQMSNFKGAKEPYHYYVNGVYQTGWEYMQQVIGSPLIINRTRASKYFEEIEAPQWNPEVQYPMNYNMPGNRVVAAHLGLLASPFPKLKTKTLLSFARYYPNKDSQDILAPHKNQGYALQQLTYQAGPMLTMNADVGIDWGDLSRNTGLMLGLVWHIRPYIISDISKRK
ncbi:capsule assembly Wzi family protein [Porifericola rhodea]|uniref:capsule assembly Wzi family protein n=1 Tax=Porifericola rhodea TaxID=930972 RepID=UPI0026658C35|nr:capsule assembly Wzi family protein [Porifericola rhodea]WKN32543.1 capsule assembly Wzi family protein [Porifericola rhodea]